MGLLHNKCAGRVVAAAGSLLIALLVTGPGSAAPLELYGRLPTVEDVALSPDGSRLAVIRTNADKRMLLLVSLTDRKLLDKPILLGDVKLRSIEWADNDHLMIVASSTGMPLGLIGRTHEWYVMNVWDVRKHKLTN